MKINGNIIEDSNGSTHVINGGNPLEGCPKSWNEARKWEEYQNKNKNKFNEPTWSFDCGFKLDFDGPLVSVDSRFYPPKTHYGEKWDGSISISLLENVIIKKYFKCDTLDELKFQVESFVKEYSEKIKDKLKDISENYVL